MQLRTFYFKKWMIHLLLKITYRSIITNQQIWELMRKSFSLSVIDFDFNSSFSFVRNKKGLTFFYIYLKTFRNSDPLIGGVIINVHYFNNRNDFSASITANDRKQHLLALRQHGKERWNPVFPIIGYVPGIVHLFTRMNIFFATPWAILLSNFVVQDLTEQLFLFTKLLVRINFALLTLKNNA